MFDSRDPHLPFDDVVKDLKRTHRRRDGSRTAMHSRPRTKEEVARRLRNRWVLAVVLALGLALVVAFLVPT
jgi:hypothetical protein